LKVKYGGIGLCDSDIVLDKEHAELDACYRESLDGILRLYHLENNK
jgi:predicted metalloendopeptidase